MKQKIYNSSPLILKKLFLNVQTFLNHRMRYNEDFEKYLEFYKNLWTEDLGKIKSYQKEELIKLMLECKRYVPLYKKRFQEKGITDEMIKADPEAMLKSIPILLKSERKSLVDDLVNQNPERKLAAKDFTSGTSGSPTINYLDKESINRAFALWSRFHYNIGLKRNDKQVRLSGKILINPTQNKAPFWIYSWIDKQLFMSTYHLKNEYMGSYVDKLNSYKPQFIDGYPSAVYILSRYINANNLSLDFIPKAIATTAETLYDFQRDEIEKAFKCKVYNQYASSEGSPFITECKEGKLHVNLDSGYFEFLNENDEPAKDGEIARLVVTSFRNYKTPLLRYDIQDTVLLDSEKLICGCGCQLPTISKIIGREDDILWTEEKGYVGRMDTAYKGLKGIIKSQIIQKSPTEIIVNAVVDEDYNAEIEKKFIHNLEDRLGRKINIKINILDDIPLGANGKFDAVSRLFKIE